MKDSIGQCARVISVVAMAMVLDCGQMAWAGWTGSMNGSGYGMASANVTSSTSNSNTANSIIMTGPSAAIKPTSGYNGAAALPSGASTKTYSRIKGQAGYVWQASTVANNGDKTDNGQLTGYVTATSRQASTTLEVQLVNIETNSPSCSNGLALYTFQWHWSGTDAGTAQQVKFYEYDSVLPNDFNGDISTVRGSRPLLQYPIVGSVPQFCEGPCPTNFDEIVTASFCAPNDPNVVYMLTDGIAVSLSLPCSLSFTGFLPPIGGADATGGNCSTAARGFKLGSTIPVKMILVDCDGVPVITGDHKITVIKCDGQTGSETAIDATPTDAATTGNLFRLTDATTGEWHFNLGTKLTGMTKGTWKIIVTLSDGSVHYAYVDLKR